MNRTLAACLLLMASGCATEVQRIPVQPECTVPPQPALPTITRDELAVLPDDVYWRLERREKRLTDWALEMRAALQGLCSGVPGG